MSFFFLACLIPAQVVVQILRKSQPVGFTLEQTGQGSTYTLLPICILLCCTSALGAMLVSSWCSTHTLYCLDSTRVVAIEQYRFVPDSDLRGNSAALWEDRAVYSNDPVYPCHQGGLYQPAWRFTQLFHATCVECYVGSCR
jgi:hypothetical protein